MVEVPSMKCPYCSKDVFFPVDVESGYCSSCGKIIYTDSAFKLSLSGSTSSAAQTGSHAPNFIEHKLWIIYTKRPLSSYNAAAEVSIDGPISKSFVATSGKYESFILPEGKYKITAKCRINAGVRSQDAFGTFDFDLTKDRTVQITNGSSMIASKLHIQYE